MSGIPRPDWLHYNVRIAHQVTDANALVKALILVLHGLDLEEAGHGLLLVVRAQKVVREAAAGNARRNLWQARRSANSSDPRTCVHT
jgi:hypothetical protein